MTIANFMGAGFREKVTTISLYVARTDQSTCPTLKAGTQWQAVQCACTLRSRLSVISAECDDTSMRSRVRTQGRKCTNPTETSPIRRRAN